MPAGTADVSSEAETRASVQPRSIEGAGNRFNELWTNEFVENEQSKDPAIGQLKQWLINAARPPLAEIGVNLGDRCGQLRSRR
jgi:hypothetical protein